MYAEHSVLLKGAIWSIVGALPGFVTPVQRGTWSTDS